MNHTEHTAKAPSPRTGLCATLGSRFRGSGSSAPSHRLSAHAAIAVLATLALALTLAPAASAAVKKVAISIGSPTGATGTTGGLFGTNTRGIAVNQTGAGGAGGGEIYVVDSTNNRIQEFTAAGAFVRAWGINASSANSNEMQAVMVNAAAGKFKLVFGAGGPGFSETGELAYNVPASGGVGATASVQNALNALTNISGSGSVTVSGGPGNAGGTTPYLIDFNGGSFAGTNVVTQITGTSAATPNELSGGTGTGANLATGSTFVNGGTGTTSFEICEVAASCLKAGTAATGGGMSAPQGIAVDQATGNVYVTDQSLLRVDEFDAKGNYIRSWGQDVVSSGPHNGTGAEICTAADVCKTGTTGSIAGAFKSTFSGQLAVAPASSPNPGDVYVADPANFRIDEFTSAGAFVRAWGRDVDATTASTDFEVCPAADTCKIGTSGTEAGMFGSNSSATRVAVDSTGKVYATDVANKRIQRFDPSGESPAVFFAATGVVGEGEESAPTDVAVGPSNTVFVVHPCPAGALGQEAFCPNLALRENRIKEFNSAGVLQATSLEGAGFTVINGLAANTGNDRVYITTSGSPTGSRAFVLDDAGALPVPAATITPPTEISAHCATFAGTVNPNGPTGIPTSYHFEYSLNGVTWTPVAADVNLGEGTSPVDVPIGAEGSVCGLQANTFYRVRIVANKAFGAATGISPELTFLTDEVPPEVQTLYPQAVSDTTARLMGLLNANNLPTTYRFEYGKTTAYGTNVPVPDATASDGIAHLVFEEAEGLEPNTTYHYRLVATNAEGTAKGEDVSFTTHAALAAPGPEACPNAAVRAQQRFEGIPNPPDCRAYEMVTPPFKLARNGGMTGGALHRDPNVGFPSTAGDRVLWGSHYFPPLEGEAFPTVVNAAAIQRGAAGWTGEPLLTKAPILPSETSLSGGFRAGANASSGNLEVQSWNVAPTMPLLENASALPEALYTRKDGTGTNGFSNWLPNVEAATVPYGLVDPEEDKAQFNDDGSWMVRWGQYRGLLGASAAQDPSVAQLHGTAGGRTVYLQGNPPAGPLDLVNGCTGTTAGADSTQIPARIGSGVATDTIGAQDCEQGSPTSLRGAVAGGGNEAGFSAAKGTAATAMSDNGRRLFFESPDPQVGPTSCATTTGAATSCPPQLYARSYDSNHQNPIVRWVSRSRSHPVGGNGYDGAMIANQQIGLLGAGAGFEGASRDGSIVYFRTNAPLTPDDPNGAGVAPPPGGVTTGAASTSSWDLYQYKLPAAGDPGEGTLTRISGGPTGSADPDANSSNGEQRAARYISEDGKRVYFVTDSPIAGADNTPPRGGTTTPGGSPGGSVRDLYLFDETKPLAERYSFIAQLPTTGGTGNFNECATTAATNGPGLSIFGYGEYLAIRPGTTNCLRGTPSGSAIAFETRAQLTVDDTDQAADVYLYDARRDELVRVSVPLPGASPYGCDENQDPSHTSDEFCNADLGFGGVAGGSQTTYDAMRGWGGGRNYNIAEDAAGHVSVYFESRSKLLPADTNSGPGTDNYWDVYQWREGRLSLVSPGDTNNDAYYSGNSLDGSDVFFQTSQRIDPREIDPADADIYDARIGGGFPYTPPATPCDVLALQCQAAPAVAPPAATPASRAPTEGNVKQRPCPKGKVRKHGRCVKRHHKRRHRHHRRARTANANRRAGK